MNDPRTLPVIFKCVDDEALHDDTPAGLVAAEAVARLSTGEHGLRLDDGGDGGSDAARHIEGLTRLVRIAKVVMIARTWFAGCWKW
jgi:hypothetical protein